MKKLLIIFALALAVISTLDAKEEKADKGMIGIHNTSSRPAQLILEYYSKKTGTDSHPVSISPNKMVQYEYIDDEKRKLSKITNKVTGSTLKSGTEIKERAIYMVP